MDWVQLHGQHQGRLLSHTKGRRLLSLQMQRCGFLKMLDGFIQRPSLSDDGNFKTLGYIADFVTSRITALMVCCR